MKLVLDFIQTASVIVVLSYLLSRARFFSQLCNGRELSLPKRLITSAVFLFIALYGVLLRAHFSSGLYVDTRIAGIMLPGFLFGPLISLYVLIPTVIVSVFTAGETFAADLCAMLLAFMTSFYCRKRFPKTDAVFSGIIVGILEICHMLLIVFLVRPIEAAKAIIYKISFPMIVINGCAVIAFILIISDMNERQEFWEKESFSKSENAVAKRIQRSLLEDNFSIDPRLDLSAYLEAAYAVGGDLYSFLLDGGRYFKFIVGDVSGKGIPASITMSRAETLFQEIAHRCSTPNEILSSLNERLCKNNKAQMFVTAFAGILDLKSGELLYANAGHVTPYLIEAGQKASPMERPRGTALGIRKDAHYGNAVLQLHPGQYLLSYTDGVTEAENPRQELFGSERLEKALSYLPQADAEKVQKSLLGAVRTFTEGAAQSDDIAIFAFGLKEVPLRCSFKNEIPAFSDAAEQIHADLTSSGLNPATIADLELVLEEIVSNIIRYGYREGSSGEITVSVWPHSENPVLQIEDDSHSFDPFEAQTPAIKIAPAERSPGGMGIFLTKNRVLSHSYASGDINTLTLQIRGGTQP